MDIDQLIQMVLLSEDQKQWLRKTWLQCDEFEQESIRRIFMNLSEEWNHNLKSIKKSHFEKLKKLDKKLNQSVELKERIAAEKQLIKSLNDTTNP